MEGGGLDLDALNASSASAAQDQENGGDLNSSKRELKQYWKSLVQSSNENNSYLKNYMARKNTMLSKKNGTGGST